MDFFTVSFRLLNTWESYSFTDFGFLSLGIGSLTDSTECRCDVNSFLTTGEIDTTSVLTLSTTASAISNISSYWFSPDRYTTSLKIWLNYFITLKWCEQSFRNCFVIAWVAALSSRSFIYGISYSNFFSSYFCLKIFEFMLLQFRSKLFWFEEQTTWLGWKYFTVITIEFSNYLIGWALIRLIKWWLLKY